MSRYWFFLVLILSASSTAQQQTHSDAATALFEAMHSEEAMQETFERVFSQLPELQTQMGVPEDRQAKSEQRLKEVTTMIQEVFTSERMRDQFIAVYTEVFTEQELRELADFYTSPIGKKYVEKQPELAQAAMKITGEMMQELMPRIKEISSMTQVEETEAHTESDR
ncbi:MAG: DUF2059 domain-containing protein [Gammaproteobacteria bacterium]|nr:DUF2059 domain-containing protein [Gammaproteobacteria bacterium]